MGAFGRKLARAQQKTALKNMDTAKLAEAAKALGNIDQVKQLNDLLGVVLQIEPMLGELRTVCAMLIQEKLVLERKVQRLEEVLPKLLAHIGADTDFYKARLRQLLAEWDVNNPPPSVELPEEIQPVVGEETLATTAEEVG
jgi:hypothetical protein